MLTAIVQHSEELIAFINALNIVLYQSQIRHLIQLVDVLLTSNETKTISGLYRLLKGEPDPKSGADFLRESPTNSTQPVVTTFVLSRDIYLMSPYQKMIETTCSLLEQLLPKHILAVTARGFELKVALFVVACSINYLVVN